MAKLTYEDYKELLNSIAEQVIHELRYFGEQMCLFEVASMCEYTSNSEKALELLAVSPSAIKANKDTMGSLTDFALHAMVLDIDDAIAESEKKKVA